MSTTTISLPRWDMTPYFPGIDSVEFANYFEKTKTRFSALESWFDSNQIGALEQVETNAQTIAKFDQLITELNGALEDLMLVTCYIYAFVTTDSKDEVAQAKESECDTLNTVVSKLSTRLNAWLGKIDVEALLSQSAIARDHEYQVRRSSFLATKQMSPAEETLASDLGVFGHTAWSKLHGQVTSQISVDIEIEGEKRSLSMSELRNLATHANSSIRKAAYEAELAAWKSVETPLTLAMNAIKGETELLAKNRGWSGLLEESIYGADIDRGTLEAMLDAAKDSFPSFRKYMNAKAVLLGKKQMGFYDLFAPVGEDRSWSYPEAENFVEEHFRGYSDKMGDFARRSFRENWTDAEPRKGKVGGAFCMGPRGDESRILMNYVPSFGSMSVLAHELGHAYHNVCLKDRTSLQSNPPMTLAETASIFCETLIKKAAMKQVAGKEKIAILEGSLQGNCQTVVDISSRFIFEKEVCERRSQRELSGRELCEIMRDAQLKTYGDGLNPEELHPYMWAVKPHYYDQRGFYNFPYMFGLLFSLGLYAIYQSEPNGFHERYDDLLASTSMADAATLANRFGINIREKAFWKASLGILEDDINEFVRLVNA